MAAAAAQTRRGRRGLDLLVEHLAWLDEPPSRAVARLETTLGPLLADRLLGVLGRPAASAATQLFLAVDPDVEVDRTRRDG